MKSYEMSVTLRAVVSFLVLLDFSLSTSGFAHSCKFLKSLHLVSGCRRNLFPTVSSTSKIPFSKLSVSVRSKLDNPDSIMPETLNKSPSESSSFDEAERLKKWSKDFQYLPDAATWNRGCVALQVFFRLICS